MVKPIDIIWETNQWGNFLDHAHAVRKSLKSTKKIQIKGPNYFGLITYDDNSCILKLFVLPVDNLKF